MFKHLRPSRQSTTGDRLAAADEAAAVMERARLAALAKVAKNPAKEFSNEKQQNRERERFLSVIKQSSVMSLVWILAVPTISTRAREHIYLYAFCAPLLLVILTVVIATGFRAAILGKQKYIDPHLSKIPLNGSPSNLLQSHVHHYDASIQEKEKALLTQLRTQLTAHRPSFEKIVGQFTGKYDQLRRKWFSTDDMPSSVDDLEEFNKLFSKHIFTDYRLVRFLRACDYDLARAESFALESIYCLALFRLDSYHERYRVPCSNYIFPEGFGERAATTEDRIARWWMSDKEGRLAMFYRIGTFDIDAWYKEALKQDSLALLKSTAFSCALYRQDSDFMHEASNGDVDSTVTLVVDLQNFQLKQLPSIQFLAEIVREVLPFLSSCYPEISANLIVVNAPVILVKAFGLLRPVLERISHVNVDIVGKCYVERHLYPYFHEEFIPKYLGGKLTSQPENDPFCRDRLLFSGGFCETSKQKLNLLKATA